jgi:hypothetical protein
VVLFTSLGTIASRELIKHLVAVVSTKICVS